MANILNSPGRYVQGAGELSRLGSYAKEYGRKALLLISASGYKRTGSVLAVSYTHLDVYKRQCQDRTTYSTYPATASKTKPKTTPTAHSAFFFPFFIPCIPFFSLLSYPTPEKNSI